MQFLKTLFWVVLAFAAALFTRSNWTPVAIVLWGGLEAQVMLPVLLFGAFLIGLLPTLALHRATRWSMRRRLESSERSLADVRASLLPAAIPGDAVAIDAPAQS